MYGIPSYRHCGNVQVGRAKVQADLLGKGQWIPARLRQRSVGQKNQIQVWKRVASARATSGVGYLMNYRHAQTHAGVRLWKSI